MTFQDHSGQASGSEEDDRILIFPFNQNIFSPVEREGSVCVCGGAGPLLKRTNSQTFTSRPHDTTQLYGRKKRNMWRKSLYFIYQKRN